MAVTVTLVPWVMEPPPVDFTSILSLDSSEWKVPDVPSAQELLMVFGWFGSAPPDMVSRPNSNEGPESHDDPTVAHCGAFSVELYTAVCAPPAVPTVNEMVAVAVVEPLVPVTVTLVVPAVAVDDAVKVKVEVALPLAGGVTGLVENAAVTPAGSADTLNVVAELKLFWLATVIVLFAVEPCVTLTALGTADTVKPGVPAPTAKIRSS